MRVAMLVLLTFVNGCQDRGRPTESELVNPQYVEIYSLSRECKGTHTVPIRDRDGKLWYRESASGFDLSYCWFDEAHTGLDRNGRLGIILCFTGHGLARFNKWADERDGYHGGFVLNGRLINVEKNEGAIGTNVIMISGFATDGEALKQLAIIKAGGLPSTPSSQPQSENARAEERG